MLKANEARLAQLDKRAETCPIIEPTKFVGPVGPGF